MKSLFIFLIRRRYLPQILSQQDLVITNRFQDASVRLASKSVLDFL